jgi:CheY-like chemotaxis protein
MSDPRPAAAVLIVEDDPESRRALEWVLELGGYVPVAVETGREALEYLRDAPAAELVILDLRLPDIPGDVVYARVREEPALRELPVIVHTGLTEIPPMPGVFATILKGATPRTLLGAIDEAVARRVPH